METDNGKTLAQLIEKIVTSGQISRDDQDEINRMVQNRSVDDHDVKAMSNLTDLITTGRINVI
jgi:hypothetical protein